MQEESLYEVETLDPMNKEDMLAKIDVLRESVENGDVMGFAYVALGSNRSMIHAHDFYPAQRVAMIGLMHIKLQELTQCYTMDEVMKGLGLDSE